MFEWFVVLALLGIGLVLWEISARTRNIARWCESASPHIQRIRDGVQDLESRPVSLPDDDLYDDDDEEKDDL